jgi:hypothetical protein
MMVAVVLSCGGFSSKLKCIQKLTNSTKKNDSIVFKEFGFLLFFCRRRRRNNNLLFSSKIELLHSYPGENGFTSFFGQCSNHMESYL